MPIPLGSILTGPVRRGIGTIAGGIAIGEILDLIFANTGRRVSRREVIMAAKHCGIEMAAETFGISEREVCALVAKGLPRRRRGISAADMRRTRATLRKVCNIQRDVKAVTSGRRRTC